MFGTCMWIWIWAQATGFLVPGAGIGMKEGLEIVKVGQEFTVQVKLDTQNPVVVSDLHVDYSSNLQWLGEIRSASDFPYFVEPAFVHNPDSRTLVWVEGVPNPGLYGSGLKSMELVFKAVASGSATIQWGQSAPSRILSLASQPENELVEERSLSFDIVEDGLPKYWVFPFFETPPEANEVACIAGQNGAHLLVNYLSSSGQSILASEEMDLSPHERRLLEIPVEVFASGMWIVLQGTGLIGGYCLLGTDGGETLHCYPAVQPGREVIVPHVARQTDIWFTQAYLFQWNQESGPVEGVYDHSSFSPDLQGRSSTEFSFNNYFNDVIPASMNSPVFRETQYLPGLGGIELFGKHSGLQTVSLGLDGYHSSHLIFPHIARNLSLFWNGLAIGNVTRQKASLTLRPFRSTGEALPVLTTNLNPEEKMTILFRADENGQVETITVPDKAISLDDTTDYLIVDADRELVGYALFGAVNDAYLSGFQSAKKGHSQLVFPAIKGDSNRWTGFALLNLNDQAQDLQIIGYQDDGTVIETWSLTFGPGEKRIATHDHFFDDSSLDNRISHLWVIQLDGDPSLAGFELIGDLGERKVLAGILALEGDQ